MAASRNQFDFLLFIRTGEDKNYALLKAGPAHPALHFKSIEGLWSVYVSRHYRALASLRADGFYWFWIGPHAQHTNYPSPRRLPFPAGDEEAL